MTDVRLGIVGCGRIVERGYLPALRSARGIRLAAVADRVLSRGQALAPEVPAFADARTLVDSGLVDAVVVATRVDSHLEIARIAAEASLPALIEKPPTRDTHEARELGALLPQPHIAFNRRFDPELAAIRERVPVDATLDLSLRFDARQEAWEGHEPPDHVLLDLGTHLVDLVCWLAGAAPVRVRSEVTAQHAKTELELAGGRGRARISCAANRSYLESIEIRAGGRLIARRRIGGLLGNALAIIRSTPSPLVPSLARQLEAFATSVRATAPPELATAADAVTALATVDAAYASARVGSDWVDLLPELVST